MTTQDLNTLQELVDLLRSGKIVQVEFIGGPIDDPYTWTHLFFSMENFESLRDASQYRDIKILFPEKKKSNIVEPRLIDGMTPFEWPVGKNYIVIKMGDTNEGRTKTPEQRNAMQRWGQVFGLNTGTEQPITEMQEYRAGLDFFRFICIPGGTYEVKTNIDGKIVKESFANTQSVSEYIWNYFFLI